MNTPISCCRVEIDDNLIKNAKLFLKNDVTIVKKANLFALLGSEVRLKIIKLFLSYERMCVCDLSDILEMKQSPISQHLRKLKDGGVLVSKREGMTVFYSIEESIKERLIKIIEG